MIDEKKLIEDIREWSKEKEIKWTSESVISLLESAPKISGWIPCSSGKIPHAGSAVLIQLKHSTDGITGDEGITFDISFVRTSKNEWVSSCGTYPFEDVVAWMPLLEPYRGN